MDKKFNLVTDLLIELTYRSPKSVSITTPYDRFGSSTTKHTKIIYPVFNNSILELLSDDELNTLFTKHYVDVESEINFYDLIDNQTISDDLINYSVDGRFSDLLDDDTYDSSLREEAEEYFYDEYRNGFFKEVIGIRLVSLKSDNLLETKEILYSKVSDALSVRNDYDEYQKKLRSIIEDRMYFIDTRENDFWLYDFWERGTTDDYIESKFSIKNMVDDTWSMTDKLTELLAKITTKHTKKGKSKNMFKISKNHYNLEALNFIDSEDDNGTELFGYFRQGTDKLGDVIRNTREAVKYIPYFKTLGDIDFVNMDIKFKGKKAVIPFAMWKSNNDNIVYFGHPDAIIKVTNNNKLNILWTRFNGTSKALIKSLYKYRDEVGLGKMPEKLFNVYCASTDKNTWNTLKQKINEQFDIE